MKRIIVLIFLLSLPIILLSQNTLKSDKTWLVYENKTKKITEQIIIKADGTHFYQSTRFKLSKLIKNEAKSTETKWIFVIEGQKGEYEFLLGEAIMIARPELSHTTTWEVFDNFTRLNPDASKSVFKLKI